MKNRQRWKELCLCIVKSVGMKTLMGIIIASFAENLYVRKKPLDMSAQQKY